MGTVAIVGIYHDLCTCLSSFRIFTCIIAYPTGHQHHPDHSHLKKYLFNFLYCCPCICRKNLTNPFKNPFKVRPCMVYIVIFHLTSVLFSRYSNNGSCGKMKLFSSTEFSSHEVFPTIFGGRNRTKVSRCLRAHDQSNQFL